MNERISVLRRDLAAFADPGSVVLTEVSDTKVQASWNSNFGHLIAEFSEVADGLNVSFEGHMMPYAQFLAHSKLSDLAHLARNARRVHKESIYVPTQAELEDSEPQDAVELLESLLSGSNNAGTLIVFITADAGSGKTWALKELVRRRAERYSEGSVASVFLYVNAQGRALADLHEALAIALDDVRARFPYPAVAVLCREGLIVPVIDGFDELIGMASGHDDGFASLATFMEELAGQGRVIAAARSTYYRQEFIGKGRNREQPWTTISARILGWRESQRRDFVIETLSQAGNTGNSELMFQKLEGAFAENHAVELSQKPFFVAKVLELLLAEVEVASSNLLQQLTYAYAKREVEEKIVDKQKRPLATVEQLNELMITLAEEMWLEETRELDVRVVKELTVLVLGEDAASTAAGKARIERGSTMLGFLTTASRDNRVEFEHELFYAFFLAGAILRKLRDARQRTLASFMGRSKLPPRTAEILATSALTRMSFGDLMSKVARVAPSEEAETPTAAQNYGSIVLCAVRSWGGENARANSVQGIKFVDEDFGGIVFTEWTFQDVLFDRVNLIGVQFDHCHGENVRFNEPLLNPENGRLDIAGLDAREVFWGLRLPGMSLPIYEPIEVQGILHKLHFPGVEALVDTVVQQTSVRSSTKRMLEKIMRGFLIANVIWPTDDQYRAVFGDAEWNLVVGLLLKHEILRREIRPQKKTPREAYRILVKPEAVLEGANASLQVSQNILEFWDDLRGRAPERATR